MSSLKTFVQRCCAAIIFFLGSVIVFAQAAPLESPQVASPISPKFRVVAIAENGGNHILYSKRAKVWLDQLAAENNFVIDYISDTKQIDDAFLARYQLFIQLDYPPYGWTDVAAAAFQRYITQGKGGWLGFHHGTLLGEFDGFAKWQWFSDFMGHITFDKYISRFADGKVKVEDKAHPVMKGLPSSFLIKKEEWYTYDQSPRANVHVIASVDESSYQPDSKIKMGDHPVIWTNPNVAARNIYIFMGHGPWLFDNAAYTTLVRNSIFWAAGQ